MVVRSNPEFGIELALVIPYAYYLHTQGKLDTVITSRGMRPFYYFCDDVREDYKHRTIDNEAAGLNRLPNNWIHGIDSVGNPGVLDYKEWISPPYRNHYKNTEFTIDQNEQGALAQGDQEISADVEGLGVITDRQLPSYMENVWLLDEIETKYSLNETQLKIMSNCNYFITVCGGNSIMSSLFGGTVISYIHKGKELRPNYFSKDSYFRKLSNANFIPVYDVIGSINRNTYHYEVNETGTNDYSGLMKTIKETIR